MRLEFPIGHGKKNLEFLSCFDWWDTQGLFSCSHGSKVICCDRTLVPRLLISTCFLHAHLGVS